MYFTIKPNMPKPNMSTQYVHMIGLKEIVMWMNLMQYKTE